MNNLLNTILYFLNTFTSLLLTSIEMGGIYSISVLGLVISFRIIGFPDLTMEGSFTTGAAVTAVLIGKGVSPYLALFIALLSGAVAGACTALLNIKVNVSKLLAGIIMMTILYTVNLRIMGKSNYSLLNHATLFDHCSASWSKIALICTIALLVFVTLWWFLKTEFGFFLRSTGENPSVVKKLGVSVEIFTLAGLAISNALIAFSGGLLSQIQGFSDIGLGTGLIVVALASMLIGEAALSPTNIPRLLLAAVIGGWLYQFIIATGLRLGIGPWDMKLATGVLLIIAVIIRKKSIKASGQANIGCSAL